MAARLNSLVDCRPDGGDSKRLSEIALGIDSPGTDRPAWPQPCGHGARPADEVLDGAIVSDVNATAWIAYRWLEGETEPSGLTDGGGHRPEEEEDSGNRHRDCADDCAQLATVLSMAILSA